MFNYLHELFDRFIELSRIFEKNWRVEYYAIDLRPQQWDRNAATWCWTFTGACMYAINRSKKSRYRHWRIMHRYDPQIEIFVTLCNEEIKWKRIWK